MAEPPLSSRSLILSCPQCCRATAKTLSWIASHNTLLCSACGAIVRFDRERVMREHGITRVSSRERVRAFLQRGEIE